MLVQLYTFFLFVNIASTCNMATVRFVLFYRYHHALGNLIYFEDEGLWDTVVLDPQWIIDGFKTIITAKQFCLRHSELRDLWNMLQVKIVLNDTGKLMCCF